MEDSFLDPDKNLIQKLKLQSPEHFQHLVKMHLSFSLEINLDELDECDEKKFRVLKWAFPFSKKEKSTKEISKVTDTEVTAITENTIAQMYQIIQFLSQEENISEEGIFRISGAVSRQKLLINYLKNGTEINLNDKQFTVHDCATVLKTFLSNLSEPLITDAYYPAYCHVAELCKQSESTTKSKLLDCLRLMMLLLPYENAVILRHIILLLHLTSNCSQKNKMSAENLATLFTPHVFCPRKLCGEALHANTQLLWSTAVFMIQCGPELFEIPSGLLADVKLYWAEKNRRQLSPKDNLMDESTTDSGAVNTVFSFVDREKTAQENISNPTETALAQLYAHIQSLPESNKKRRLVKQFNKENGYGTPKKLLIQEDRSHLTRRNLCDSLKKHIFHNKVNKPACSSISKITPKAEVLQQPESEVMMTPRSRRPVVANSGSSMSQTAGTTPKKYGNNKPIAENNNNNDNYSSHSANGETDEETKSCDESSKFIPSDLSSGQEVLSKTFQDYLLSRSMQTATPPDSSFFSETDDISTADEKLSESLLFCLDGNVPQASSDNSVSEKNIHETVL